MFSSRQKLLDACDSWLEKADVVEATLSAMIFQDARELRRVREGGGLGIDRYDFAMKWLVDNPPDTWRALHPRGRPPVRRNTERANA